MSQAKFLQGSILRHILLMSSANAIGLTALFLVDLVDLLFISLLGEVELAAAVGYAGTISFFTTSVSIGIAITMTALVSRSIGAHQRERAKRYATNVMVFAFLVTSVCAALAWWFAPQLLSMLGASGKTLLLATDYLRILLPSLPLLSIGMACGAILRSVGDARLAMQTTLIGGVVNALLDPIFIFALGWDIHGAAVASVAARIAILIVAFRGVWLKHQLIARFRWAEFTPDLSAICRVAFPAMLTNVATPIGNAYVTSKIAGFGDGFVAGWAVVGRVIPVAFGMIFALSGAIGPIVGQNYGANQFDRVKEVLYRSLLFSTGYVFLICIALMLLQQPLIHLFGAGEDAAQLISLFCSVIAFSFIFNGALFISNAIFNNLGHATYSTLLNFGKATLGTFPFVYYGATHFGASGVLYGQALGSLLFGGLSLLVSFSLVNRLHRRYLAEQEPVLQSDIPLMPFSSERAFVESGPELDEFREKR